MDNLLRQISLQVLFFVPPILVVALFVVKRRASQARSRVPFRELRRRPAGESLRLKIGKFDEKISEWLLYLVILPAGASRAVFA